MKKRIGKILRILENYFTEIERPTVRRTSELRDPFKTLIACLLSLRTTDENTARASEALFRVADTPEEIARLPLRRLEKLIYCSGFYRNKARTIKHVSEVILKKYGGRVPPDINSLLSIKGIGRKTANIVLAFAYKKPVIPVDVHVHIISNRLGWVKTKTAEQTERALMKIVPKRYWLELNTLFVLFGKKICVTISPLCSKCPIRKYCPRIGVRKSR